MYVYSISWYAVYVQVQIDVTCIREHICPNWRGCRTSILVSEGQDMAHGSVIISDHKYHKYTMRFLSQVPNYPKLCYYVWA